MAEGLEIEGTHEEQFAIVKTAVKRHDRDLYGNGQPGVMDFMSSTKGQFRLLVIMLTAVLVILGVLTYLEGNREYHSGILPLANHDGQTVTADHRVGGNVYQYTLAERTTK